MFVKMTNDEKWFSIVTLDLLPWQPSNSKRTFVLQPIDFSHCTLYISHFVQRVGETEGMMKDERDAEGEWTRSEWYS